MAEKRLIDVNVLKERLFNLEASGGHKYYRQGMDDVLHKFMPQILDDAHTVDAVEVPCRCKECKHWKHIAHVGCSDFAKVCMLANYMIGANGYCLYGERKDNA